MSRLIRSLSFVRKELAQILRQPLLVVSLVLGPFLVLLLFGAGLKGVDPEVRTLIVAENQRMRALAERYAAREIYNVEVAEIVADRAHALERLRNGDVALVVEFPSQPLATVRGGERAVVTVYHNYLDPVESRAVELAMRQAVDTINNQVSSLLVERGQAETARLSERVGAARETLGRLRDALVRGDPREAAEQLGALEREVAELARETGGAEQRLAQAEELLGEQPVAEASASAALDTVGRELGQLAASELTTEVLPRLAAIEDGLDRAGGLLARFEALDAELLVSPFTGRVQRVSGDVVRLTDFYAPAVLVLLVQHMVVTFIGLSVVREDELGTTELFRVAPVSVGEILLGKTLAYLLLGGVVAAVLVGLLVVGLGVPMLGSWPLLAMGVAAALLAAIGLAFVVALAARSDSQAVQYAMLVLLASIFFSGFILSLDRFVPAVTFVASALPATHAIRLLRGIMLRGSAMPGVLLATLAGFAAVLLAVSWAMLRRRLARG